MFQSSYSEDVPLDICSGKEASTTFFNDNNRKIDFVLVFQDQAGQASTAEDSESAGVVAAAKAFK